MKFKKVFACALAINMVLGSVGNAFADEEFVDVDKNTSNISEFEDISKLNDDNDQYVEEINPKNESYIEDSVNNVFVDDSLDDYFDQSNPDDLTNNNENNNTTNNPETNNSKAWDDEDEEENNIIIDDGDSQENEKSKNNNDGDDKNKTTNDIKNKSNKNNKIKNSDDLDDKSIKESLDNQKPIDESIKNNKPLYGYFISDDDAKSTKFYQNRLDDLKEMLNVINSKDKIKDYQFGGEKDEEDKNKGLLEYLEGRYYAPDGFENKYTYYKSGLMMPLKNIVVKSLYKSDNPRVILGSNKGDNIYAPINSSEIKKVGKGYLLEDKEQNIKIYLSGINTKEYKNVKAGQLIGKANGEGVSFYVQKDGKFINPALIIRSELDRQLDGFFGIPNMYQTDKMWANERYGSSSISAGACGPSSISMVLSYLTGELVTPFDQVKNLGGAGSPHFINGVGSSFSIFPTSANQFDVHQKTLGNNVWNVVEELKKGHPVVLSMHQGFFTRGGHFVVASGIDSDGKIYINDPASKARGELKYTPEFIASNMKNAFAFWNKFEENKYSEELPKEYKKEVTKKKSYNPRRQMQLSID